MSGFRIAGSRKARTGISCPGAGITARTTGATSSAGSMSTGTNGGAMTCSASSNGAATASAGKAIAANMTVAAMRGKSEESSGARMSAETGGTNRAALAISEMNALVAMARGHVKGTAGVTDND